MGGALLQLWDGSSALQWGSCPQGWPCWNRAGGFGLERWECGSIAGKGWVGGGGHRAGCLPSHLVSSAQSVSASPPESPPDEEMGLKRSQEEKELPGHYVSVGLLGGGGRNPARRHAGSPIEEGGGELPVGSASRDMQPLPALSKALCIPPVVQDSDGDKSDYNLVVDEVSPGCLQGATLCAQRA